jgi:hypothetical protein
VQFRHGPTVQPASMTCITEYVVVASVQRGQLTTTPPATQQTGQQSGTASHGPMPHSREYFPRSLVESAEIVPNSHSPHGNSEVRTATAPSVCVDYHGVARRFIAHCVFCFTVGIGIAVNRVGQNSVDRCVGRTFPTGLSLPGVHRKLQIVLQEP